jgi:hypothetical protein
LKFKSYSQKAWFIKMLLSPKCSKTHLRASLIRKIFPGVIPPDPRSKGKGMGREEEGRGSGKGRKGKEGERDGRGIE